MEFGFRGSIRQDFEIMFGVASLAIIEMVFECFFVVTPSMGVVDSFSDGMNFVDVSGWRRPPKKPQNKSRNLNSF